MANEKMQAYCLKCKTQREMSEAVATFTRVGQATTKGVCSVCGTTMYKMGETADHANLEKPEKVNPATKPKAKKAKVATTTKSSSNKTSQKKSSGKSVGKLVIVESPAKARSIERYLGKGYTVKASKGHVRDLLKSRMSVDVNNHYEPEYRVLNDKRTIVNELKTNVLHAEEIYLATDPDREGEAIAWHLMQATEMDEARTKRVVFHEITPKAVQEAFEHPRAINMDLVNAQQARRVLDRLVGYQLSPLLWKKVRNYLSAGRVQSIAARLIVDREREINRFIPHEYWSIHARLHAPSDPSKKGLFTANLIKVNQQDFVCSTEAEAQAHVQALQSRTYQVSEVKRGTRKRKPSAPFTTSTLQQEGSRRLNFNTNRTMQIAQRLYEGIELGTEGPVGLITYMRTDSVNVSEEAQAETRVFVLNQYGQDYLPEKAPKYKTNAKSAQEAHEAIRPTSITRTPEEARPYLNAEELKLYTLIWQRFIASQMSDAIYNTLRVDIQAISNQANQQEIAQYLFRITGSTLAFKGFTIIYEEAANEDAPEESDVGLLIPALNEGDQPKLVAILPEQHFTQPPPRYTEASLVQTLEELGIGRPSTYAPTVKVIEQERGYVTKDGKRLVPTEIGTTVTDLLVNYFPNVMDYSFTARMEDRLDEIADGVIEWVPMIDDFYRPFAERLEQATQDMPELKQVEHVGRACPSCGDGQLIVKHGRFGKFIGCNNHPDCTHTETYVELVGIPCPTCGATDGGEISILKTKRGKVFYGCTRYPNCDYKSWKLPTKDEKINAESEKEPDLP